MVAVEGSRGSEDPNYHNLRRRQVLEDNLGLSPADAERVTTDYPEGALDWLEQRPGEKPDDFCDRVGTRPLPEKQLQTNRVGMAAVWGEYTKARAQQKTTEPAPTQSDELLELAREQARRDRRRKQQ